MDIHSFLVNDFAGAWDSLSLNPNRQGGGNFLFGLLATILLEWACRLCQEDDTGEALDEFSRVLVTIEPRYFLPLPGTCNSPSDFRLPRARDLPTESDPLLRLIFDLIRNGQAHHYQQIPLELEGGSFFIALTGTRVHYTLDRLRQLGRPRNHLRLEETPDNSMYLTVIPEMLFFDVEHAITGSKLLERGLISKPFIRPAGSHYRFIAADLKSALSGL